jgi:uncharacterized protein (DUF1684 family)
MRLIIVDHMHDTDFFSMWQEWRSEREADLKAAYGKSCPVFPPDPRWVVTATYEPYPQPRREIVDTAAGAPRSVPVHGVLRFSLDGTECTLEPYSSGPPGCLNVAFRDATSGGASYPAARVVFPEVPSRGVSTVVIDFNRAINPPCAFTPWASCAFPPAGNALPVAIEAGEQAPEPPTETGLGIG